MWVCGFRGGYCWRVTPGLIPNPVVKSLCADGTALWWGGRVGRCHGFFGERGVCLWVGPPFFCCGWGVWWGGGLFRRPPFFCVCGVGCLGSRVLWWWGVARACWWGALGRGSWGCWVGWGWVLPPSPPRDCCRPHRTRQGDGVVLISGVGGLDPCGAGGGWRLSGKGGRVVGVPNGPSGPLGPGLRPVRPWPAGSLPLPLAASLSASP